MSSCAAGGKAPSLAGDWDAYVADGSTARPGFEGWRRMGFAHFANGDSGLVGSIRRRTGEPILDVTRVVSTHPDYVPALVGQGLASSFIYNSPGALSATALYNANPSLSKKRSTVHTHF